MLSDFNNVRISSINPDNREYVCISLLEEDWYVKITDGYGHIDYLNIRENCNSNIIINDPKDIFKNDFIKLPKKYYDNLTGLIIEWKIADTNHIYSIRNLPNEYWNKSEEPKCFESEELGIYDEEESTFNIEENKPRESNRKKTFFDRIVENL